MRVEVPGVPIPQGSMRAVVARDGTPRVFGDNPQTRPWRELVAWAARQVWVGAPTPAAVEVRIGFVMPRPKSARRKRPTVKPDLDKLVRACLDALTGVVWVDDAQVVSVMASKRYVNAAEPEPGAVIIVEVIE